MALLTINNFWILRMPKAAAAQWQASTVSQFEAASALGSARLLVRRFAKLRDIFSPPFIGVAVW
jgi:hypothetical protein